MMSWIWQISDNSCFQQLHCTKGLLQKCKTTNTQCTKCSTEYTRNQSTLDWHVSRWMGKSNWGSNRNWKLQLRVNTNWGSFHFHLAKLVQSRVSASNSGGNPGCHPGLVVFYHSTAQWWYNIPLYLMSHIILLQWVSSAYNPFHAFTIICCDMSRYSASK